MDNYMQRPKLESKLPKYLEKSSMVFSNDSFDNAELIN